MHTTDNGTTACAQQVGLGSAASATAASDSKDSDGKDAAEPTPLATLYALLLRLVSTTALPEAVRAEAAETLDQGMDLFLPAKDDRVARTKELMTDEGVVEVQLQWPANATDDEGVQLKLERALIILQHYCRKNGWKYKVNGRWPAVVYLVVAVPAEAGCAAFLEGPFAECFNKAEVTGFSFPEGLQSPEFPIKVERLGGWSRRQRLLYEGGIGAVRVYPKGVATFDEVYDSLARFLPTATLTRDA